jgi:predicted amidophosphoribosyltransferase
VEPGAEVWVYFHGPHKFEHGVYVKGSVESVDFQSRAVFLRVREHATVSPLTDQETSTRLAEAVAVRFRQVFVLPDDLETVSSCNLTTTAESCAKHRCGDCKTWEALPLVSLPDMYMPGRLDGRVDSYVPAYWAIPPRTFLYSTGRAIKAAVRRTSDLFYDFKTGGKHLAYPLALGIFTGLARAEQLEVDVIVPIPLSPDKAAKGELHRTRALAQELAPMLKAPVAECLSLASPVSKRRLRGLLRYTAMQFEAAYREALKVKDLPVGAHSVLLLDDVCTGGSTLRIAAAALKAANPGVTIIAATAGQMAVKAVVADDDVLLV